MKPRIALTAAAKDLADPQWRVKYREAISLSGGDPMLVGGVAAEEVPTLLAGFDGLLLPGGLDVDLATYGGTGHPSIELAAADLDELEIAATRYARRSGLPTFAICRGMQVANVALGGSLYEDIDAHFEAPNGLRLRHRQTPDHARHETTHSIDIKRGSRLERIVGSSALATNTLHHQAVRRIAFDFEPVAWARDGIVEALELRGSHPFFVAVQWHPEELFATDEPSRRLFASFVDAAAGRAAGRQLAARVQ